MTFLAPGFLLLALAVPLVWFLPSRVTDKWLGILRTVSLLALVIALAQPVSFRKDGIRHHVIVLDDSAGTLGVEATEDSPTARIQDEVPAALAEFVARTPDADRCVLLSLGALPSVPSGVDQARSLCAAGESPLGTALELAALEIPIGASGAVTLISDGEATTRDWGSAVQALQSRGIPVNVLRLPSVAPATRLLGVEVSETVRVGATARVTVDLVSDGRVFDVRLLGPDAKTLDRRSGPVDAGRMRMALEFEPERAGHLDLGVQLIDAGGSVLPAGEIRTLIGVQDPVSVLYLGQRVQGGADQLQRLVGPGFRIEAGAATPDQDPHSYDLVMLDDVSTDRVPAEYQERLSAAVTRSGVGLLMAGGKAAFGGGGWHKTPVAELLPTEFLQREEKRDPSTTLCVIIDTSGSMGGNRVQLAKEVARLAIRRLLPHDKVGIVEFFGAKRWAAPIQPASNAIEIERALNRLNAGGGTVIMPAIEEAFYGMQNVRTRYKHVLVLTDGGVERGAFEPLLRRMAARGINTSTVLIGPQAHSEFLVSIANWGKGRFYNVPNRFNLPEIILKQPASARLPAYRPGTIDVEAQGGSRWWGSDEPRGLPPLSGYVEARARRGAQTLLRVATAKGRQPVVATWRNGLGRVTAMLTEPTGPGTASWREWDGYGPWLARLLQRTAADDRDPLHWSIERRGEQVIVTARARIPGTYRPQVGPSAPSAGGPVAVRTPLQQIAPDLYELSSSVAPDKAVRWVAEEHANDWTPVYLASAARADVSREDQVAPDRALDLEALAAATGGRVLPLEGERPAPAHGKAMAPLSLRDLMPLFILIGLLTWLGELFYRRFERRRPGGAA